jgi:hypothetical protein
MAWLIIRNAGISQAEKICRSIAGILTRGD